MLFPSPRNNFLLRIFGLLFSNIKPTVLLTNKNLVFFDEFVGRQLEVERSRSLANTARNVVVGTVARAEPAVILTSARNWHTAEVSANTQHHKPVGKACAQSELVFMAIVSKHPSYHS